MQNSLMKFCNGGAKRAIISGLAVVMAGISSQIVKFLPEEYRLFVALGFSLLAGVCAFCVSYFGSIVRNSQSKILVSKLDEICTEIKNLNKNVVI